MERWGFLFIFHKGFIMQNASHMRSFLIMVSVVLCSLILAQHAESNEYHFKKIEGFHIMSLELYGTASEIGLSCVELTDHVKLKFKNNFKGIKILTFPELTKIREKEREKGAFLSFVVFTTGSSDYPVAFHVQCTVCDYYPSFTAIIWDNDILGFATKSNISDRIKGSINTLIERLAIDFFKARGEL